ncbi:MAG: Gfo/Idh/MocA family oxidoreductase [Phycisphaerae bacterium]|nr:Gfo/Idh/MocA family oxidoreductase [Phycisphaerae bacterium]
MKKLKIGLVGLSRGKGFLNVFAAHPDVEVSALCDVDESRIDAVADGFAINERQCFTDYDGFLDAGMDAVMIATPIPMHTEHTVKALQSGRHVLCEQTMAYTVEECREVVDAVKKSGMKYMMAENYTYFDYVIQWKRMIDEGKLGKIYYAEGEYIHEIIQLLRDPDTGQYRWRHERPPIWYCAHTLGPLLTLMDDRVVAACGLTTGFNKCPDYADHPGFLDIEIGLFKTQKGAIVKILRSQVAARRHMVWYCLYGTHGHLENSRIPKEKEGPGHSLFIDDPQTHTIAKGDEPIFYVNDKTAPPEAQKGGHGTSEYHLIREFINAIKEDRNPQIDVIRSCDFTLPGIVAHESAMQGGQWLDVPMFSW